eukprot:4435345-Heterocapsa_arctica.AAC.1
MTRVNHCPDGTNRLEAGVSSFELIENVWGPTRCDLPNAPWKISDTIGAPPVGFAWKWMIYDPMQMTFSNNIPEP